MNYDSLVCKTVNSLKLAKVLFVIISALVCSCDESSLFSSVATVRPRAEFKLCADKRSFVYVVEPLLISLPGSYVAQRHINVRQYPRLGSPRSCLVAVI